MTARKTRRCDGPGGRTETAASRLGVCPRNRSRPSASWGQVACRERAFSRVAPRIHGELLMLGFSVSQATAGHRYNQMPNLAGKPRAPTAPASIRAAWCWIRLPSTIKSLVVINML